MFKVLSYSLLLIVITACGGGGSSDEPTAEAIDETSPTAVIYTGVFLDSAVEGLNYQTVSQNGKTTELGEFTYQEGERITFSIGSIVLPNIPADTLLTPFNVFDSTDINNVQVVNLFTSFTKLRCRW